jgi:cytoskeletal protein CcmA (bactofilin family)
MFGKKTNDSMTNSSVPGSGAINSLVAGTKIEGKVNASSDIRIDGSLKGTLKCSGRVIIGQQGSVNGDIFCQNAIIEGHFDGKLEVNETLSVKETASVTGDINTQKLMVQNGAVFNVNCTMGGHKVKSIDASTVDKKTKTAVVK